MRNDLGNLLGSTARYPIGPASADNGPAALSQCGDRTLDLATMIVDLHPIDARELARNGIVVDGLKEELHIGYHDSGRTADDDVDGLAVVLARFDLAVLELAPEAIGLGDESAAIDASEVREGQLVRPALVGEHFSALLGARGPGTREIESVRVTRQSEDHARRHDCAKLAVRFHMPSPCSRPSVTA
ncbi:hypothetical protein [Bradyrhizobium pachyrhizi]|uniref:hypothetical protein n=1 Tax=Bradyrhizobium pachyrhizi TaxID=280333 RepID=UPI001364D2BB|nr:hypothetical protein [Bradyrhizobium pachyrhizi]